MSSQLSSFYNESSSANIYGTLIGIAVEVIKYSYHQIARYDIYKEKILSRIVKDPHFKLKFEIYMLAQIRAIHDMINYENKLQFSNNIQVYNLNVLVQQSKVNIIIDKEFEIQNIQTEYGLIKTNFDQQQHKINITTEICQGNIQFACILLFSKKHIKYTLQLSLISPASEFELNQLKFTFQILNEMRIRQQQADYKDIYKSTASNVVIEIHQDKKGTSRVFHKIAEKINVLASIKVGITSLLQQDTNIKQKTLQLIKQNYNQIILERVCYLLYNVKEFHSVYEYIYKQSVNTGIMAEKTVERLSVENTLTNKAVNQINIQQVNIYFIRSMLKLVYALDQFIVKIQSQNNKLALFEQNSRMQTSVQVLSQFVSILVGEKLNHKDEELLFSAMGLNYFKPAYLDNTIIDLYHFYKQQLSYTERDIFNLTYFNAAVYEHIKSNHYFSLPDDISNKKQLYTQLVNGSQEQDNKDFYNLLIKQVFDQYSFNLSQFNITQFMDYLIFGLLLNLLVNINKLDYIQLNNYQILTSEKQLINQQQLKKMQNLNLRQVNNTFNYIIQYLQKRNIQKYFYQNIIQITYYDKVKDIFQQIDTVLVNKDLQLHITQDKHIFNLYLILFINNILFIRNILQLNDLLKINLTQHNKLECHLKILLSQINQLKEGDFVIATRYIQQYYVANKHAIQQKRQNQKHSYFNNNFKFNIIKLQNQFRTYQAVKKYKQKINVVKTIQKALIAYKYKKNYTNSIVYIQSYMKKHIEQIKYRNRLQQVKHLSLLLKRQMYQNKLYLTINICIQDIEDYIITIQNFYRQYNLVKLIEQSIQLYKQRVKQLQAAFLHKKLFKEQIKKQFDSFNKFKDNIVKIQSFVRLQTFKRKNSDIVKKLQQLKKKSKSKTYLNKNFQQFLKIVQSQTQLQNLMPIYEKILICLNLNQISNISFIQNYEILNFSACCNTLYSQKKKQLKDFKIILNLLYLSLMLKQGGDLNCYNKTIQESELETIKNKYVRIDKTFASTMKMILSDKQLNKDCFVKKYCMYIDKLIQTQCK